MAGAATVTTILPKGVTARNSSTLGVMYNTAVAPIRIRRLTKNARVQKPMNRQAKLVLMIVTVWKWCLSGCVTRNSANAAAPANTEIRKDRVVNHINNAIIGS